LIELIGQIQPVELLIYLATGAVAGILAGLLGVGGGLFIVPVLLLILPQVGIDSTHLLTIAIATSLATIVFTSISSVRAHHKKGAVIWNKFFWLSPGLVIGAWLGAFVADWLSKEHLTLFFGCAVILIGLQMFLGKQPERASSPKKAAYAIAGVFIGTVSSMIGIGGGSLSVPLLHHWNTSMVKAVATSAAGGLPIAMAGTIGFIVSGWNQENLPSLSSGYVYWPAAFGIVISSVFFAPIGAHWAHIVPAKKLKKFFAIFLVTIGIKVLIG